jgi:hypothetical protein
VRGRVVRADGGGGRTGGIGLGHTRTVEETVLARLLDTPALRPFPRHRSPGGTSEPDAASYGRVARRRAVQGGGTGSLRLLV